uniref:ZM domain-containing protein n=1 Tax=Strongyloides stercoralis TaxID=6248 RepID=A0A0K0E9I3_STRER
MKNVESKELRSVNETNYDKRTKEQLNADNPINMKENLTTNISNTTDECVIEGSEKFPTLLAAIRKVDTPPRISIEKKELNEFQQQFQNCNLIPSQFNIDNIDKPLKRKYNKKSKLPNITNEYDNYPSKGEDIFLDYPRHRGPKRFKSMESTKVDGALQNYNYTNFSIPQGSYTPESVKSDYTTNNSNPLSRISFNPNYPFDDGDENIRNNQIDNSIQNSQYFPDNYNNNVSQSNTNYMNNQVNYQYTKPIINNTPPTNFSMYNNLPENGPNFRNESTNITNPQPYSESSKNFINTKNIDNNKITTTIYTRRQINYLPNAPYLQYPNIKKESGVIYSNNSNGSIGGANNLTKTFVNDERQMYNITTNNINKSFPPNINNNNSNQNIMAQKCQSQTRYLTNFPNIHPNTRSNNVDGNYNNFYQNTYTGNSQNTSFTVTQQTSPTFTRTGNILPINNESFQYQTPKYETFSNVNKSYTNTSISTNIPLNSSSSSFYNINKYEENFPTINKYQYHNQEPSVVYQNIEEI